MPDTNSTFQLLQRDPNDVENASAANQYRVFLSSVTGLLSLKDNLGNVTTIGGAVVLATTMVSVIGPASYNANYRDSVLVDPSGGAVTIVLPTVVGFDGWLIEVINLTSDVTPITIQASNPQNIISELGTQPTYEMNTPNERRYLRASVANSAWILTG